MSELMMPYQVLDRHSGEWRDLNVFEKTELRRDLKLVSAPIIVNDWNMWRGTWIRRVWGRVCSH